MSVQDDYFDPADITVPSGTTVVWTNEGEKPHTVTAHDSSFDSGTLYPGESYQVTFCEPGTYTYLPVLRRDARQRHSCLGGTSRWVLKPCKGAQNNVLELRLLENSGC